MKSLVRVLTLLAVTLLLSGCGSFHLVQVWVPVEEAQTGGGDTRASVYEVVETYADSRGFQCTRSEHLLNCAGRGAVASSVERTYMTGYRCLCTPDSAADAGSDGRLTIEFDSAGPAPASADFLRTRDRLVKVLAEADYTCDCAEGQVQQRVSSEGDDVGIILAEGHSDMVIVKYMQQSDNLGPPSATYRQNKEALLEELRRHFENVRIR